MKKILILVVVAGLLVAALPALAADDEGETQLAQLHRQVLELRKQIIDIHVQQGDLDQDEAAIIKERMEEHYENRNENDFPFRGGNGWRPCHGESGNGRGPGRGMMGFWQ